MTTPKPIVVLVAMRSELHHLLRSNPPVSTDVDGIWTDHHLRIAGRPVIACRTGVGMIAAAAATERAVNLHQPDAVLNYGCAGAHHRDLFPGDVVIGTSVAHHSKITIHTSGDEIVTPIVYRIGDDTFRVPDLPCDETLVAAAQSAATSWRPDSWPAKLFPISLERPSQVHLGGIASADVWTQSHARIAILHARHASLCEDMEAAAIAQVCAMHETPFLTIKDISNNELLVATDLANFGDVHGAEIGKRAAALTIRTLTQLSNVCR